MIEQTAVVTETTSDTAKVKVYRESTCGGCQAKSACGTSSFAKVLGNKFSVVSALNPIHAEPGDVVKIGMRESVMLQSAFLVYMFPLVMLFSGALVFNAANLWFALNLGQIPTIVGGLTGLAIAFVLIRKTMSRRHHDERYQPVILSKASLADMNRLQGEKSINFVKG